MRHLRPFEKYNNLQLFESTRFTHLKEVLDTIEDMCLDIKDEGFETSFGIMPTGENVANFDTYLDDIQIKLASLGKRVMCVKFDVSKNLDKFKDERGLEMFIDNFMRVYNYILGEDLIVKGFWTKELVVVNRSDYGKTKYFFYENLDLVLNQIDWLRKEKLNNTISKIDRIKTKKDIYDFRLLEDVRIVFTGQPIEDLLESKESEIWSLREDLYEKLLPLKDSGYDVNIYSHHDSKDNLNQIGVYIKSDDFGGKINIDSEFISCLQDAVSYMNNNDYHYSAKYHTYRSLPQKFYIYTDSRQLRAGGSKMDQNWPNCFKITIDFYHEVS